MGYYISLITGVLLLLISVYLFRGSLQFLQSTERALAEVVEIERVDGSDGDTFKPVFKFHTLLHEEIYFKQNYSSSPPHWHIGDEVMIAYKADDPQDAKILTYFGSFGYSVVLMALAAPLLIIGGGYIFCQQFLK